MSDSKGCDLQNLFHVLCPYGSLRSFSNLQVSGDGRLKWNMQEVLSKMRNVQSHAFCYNHVVEDQPALTRVSSRSLLYEYTKLCKTVKYLPDGLAKFMQEEAKAVIMRAQLYIFIYYSLFYLNRFQLKRHKHMKEECNRHAEVQSLVNFFSAEVSIQHGFDLRLSRKASGWTYEAAHEKLHRT